MENRMLWLPAFLGGMAVGALIASLLPRLRASTRPHARLVGARPLISNRVREKGETDIRGEIFRATEAVNIELTRCLRLLLNSTQKLLLEIQENRDKEGKPNPS